MANIQSGSSRGVELRNHDGITLLSGRRIQNESPVARRHVSNVISIQDWIAFSLSTHSSGVLYNPLFNNFTRVPEVLYTLRVF